MLWAIIIFMLLIIIMAIIGLMFGKPGWTLSSSGELLLRGLSMAAEYLLFLFSLLEEHTLEVAVPR